MTLLTPSEDMVLRYTVTDGSTNTTVEGAVDEVHLTGVWVDCEDCTPPSALAPNPVGASLLLDRDQGGHAALSWTAPPTDAGHDAATLYRIDRDTAPDGPFPEAGSATATSWHDVDPISPGAIFFYLVRAGNAGGSE